MDSISNKKCIITVQKKNVAKKLIKSLFNYKLIEVAQLKKVTNYYNICNNQKRTIFKIKEYEILINYKDLYEESENLTIDDKLELFKDLVYDKFNGTLKIE